MPSLLRKGTHFQYKPTIVVYPNVIQSERDETTLLTKESKGIQTEILSMKFDEGTQCDDEKVIVRTQGIQTSPGASGGTDSENLIKQHLVQSLASTTTTVTTPPIQATSRQLSTDAVTLIASTAAAAAVAASTSLHNNNKCTQVCLTTSIMD